MTIAFMGGEMAAFLPADSSATETTSMGYFSSAFSRCALKAGPSSYNESPAFTGLADVWVHARIGVEDFSAGSVDALALVDGSDVNAVKLTYDRGTDTLSLKYWNGAAFVTVGSISIEMSVAAHDIDLHAVVNSAAGSATLYVAGTQRITGTGLALSGSADIQKVRAYGYNFPPHISQVIVADEPTIGWRLITRYPNAAGATSSFTGAYTDIDETVYSDADFILSGTNNQVSTFGQTGPSITGYTVRAVAVAGRARRGASGPQNLQLALRSAGTDYFSGSKALGVGYAPFVNIWETNPATAAAWVNTAIDTLQPGVKSIA